ncbi:MAG: hypothetical protein ACYCS7_04925 [Acidimicrobiales bacterium]
MASPLRGRVLVGVPGLASVRDFTADLRLDRAEGAPPRRTGDGGPPGIEDRGGGRGWGPGIRRWRAWWCWQLCVTIVVAALIVLVNEPEALGAGRFGFAAWVRVGADVTVAWLLVRVAFRRFLVLGGHPEEHRHNLRPPPRR